MSPCITWVTPDSQPWPWTQLRLSLPTVFIIAEGHVTLPHFLSPLQPWKSICAYIFFLSNSAQPHSVCSAMANAQISRYPPSPDALLRLLCATWVQLQWLRGEDVQDVCVWVCLLRAWAMFSEEDERTWSRHVDLPVFRISTKPSNCHLISKRQN